MHTAALCCKLISMFFGWNLEATQKWLDSPHVHRSNIACTSWSPHLLTVFWMEVITQQYIAVKQTRIGIHAHLVCKSYIIMKIVMPLRRVYSMYINTLYTHVHVVSKWNDQCRLSSCCWETKISLVRGNYDVPFDGCTPPRLDALHCPRLITLP